MPVFECKKCNAKTAANFDNEKCYTCTQRTEKDLDPNDPVDKFILAHLDRSRFSKIIEVDEKQMFQCCMLFKWVLNEELSGSCDKCKKQISKEGMKIYDGKSCANCNIPPSVIEGPKLKVIQEVDEKEKITDI